MLKGVENSSISNSNQLARPKIPPKLPLESRKKLSVISLERTCLETSSESSQFNASHGDGSDETAKQDYDDDETKYYSDSYVIPIQQPSLPTTAVDERGEATTASSTSDLNFFNESIYLNLTQSVTTTDQLASDDDAESYSSLCAFKSAEKKSVPKNEPDLDADVAVLDLSRLLITTTTHTTECPAIPPKRNKATARKLSLNSSSFSLEIASSERDST
jgi:hypothetical protein